MRYDYLQKYWNKYSDSGFKRLVNEGYLFTNANYNYVPTYTAPGHACIYTGTTPSVNGIVSNEWFDRASNKEVYCVADSTVQPIGTSSSAGRMSPKNLMSSTVTDELRKSDPTSKVISISLKDRGAVLPGGHQATAAYWHDPSTNAMVTSSYYMQSLPTWVAQFNERHLIDSLLQQPWTTLLPIEQYQESGPDSVGYEGLFKGETAPVFPHNLPAIKLLDKELIRRTPFGNTFLKEFAIAALSSERLGKGNATDFLAISFSSTDYVGHMFGTNAIELEDTYIRLDRDLTELLTILETQVGKNNYLVFLTADHGAADNPDFAKQGGFASTKKMVDSVKVYLNNKHSSGKYILSADAHEIYLDSNLVAMAPNFEIEQQICGVVEQFAEVSAAYPMRDLRLSKRMKHGLEVIMLNGYYPERSPDIMIELKPGWIDIGNRRTGTTHGSAYNYDTHVPVIFYGWNIKHGESNREVHITDIAPTISSLLNIQHPSGTTGKQLIELTSK